MTLNIRVAPQKALLSAIKNSDNDIALLIGSALSTPDSSGSKGIPNVSGVLDIIKDVVKSKDLELEYDEEMVGLNDNERYQKSFSFLADYTSQNTINEVIRKAVLHSTVDSKDVDVTDIEQLKNLQENFEKWVIPQATASLSKILSTVNKVVGPVITPNFDPLLSISLKNNGQSPSRTVLHSDCSLNQHEPNGQHIIHFHGFWVNTDTLHTPEQLGFNRPKLKASLANILKNKTLLVLGYGAWDDIFTEVLFDLMNDDSANLDIIWCFYENDEKTIINKYHNLIKAVTPAIHRRRFRAYGGINCHKFLPILSDEFAQQTLEPIEVKSVEENNISVDEQIFQNENIIIPQWKIYAEKAHSYIRDTERVQLIDILEENVCANITIDWGLGKNEFIETLISNKNSPYFNYSLFNINCEGVTSKQELLDKIEELFGFGLQSYINNLPKHNVVICFDNVESLSNKGKFSQYYEDLNSVINLINEYHNQCKILICSKKPIEHGFQSIEITKLEEYDIRSYVTNHSSISSDLGDNVLESLIKISQGTPKLLDKYIDELEVLSIGELLDSHYTPESHKLAIDDSFPVEVSNRIDSLSNSNDNHSRVSFELLKMLAIMEHGDAFANLKRANTRSTFRASHVKELKSLELIETLSINRSFLQSTDSDGGDKLLVLPSVVREYIYSQFSSDEMYNYVKKIADVHLGNKWREGALKLCPIAKDLLKESSKVTGSTYILLIHLLRSAIELNLGREIKQVYSICTSYCSYLSKNSKYREVISFIEQIRTIAKNSDKIESYASLDLYYGHGLRMTKRRNESDIVLERAYEKLEELTKHEKEILLIQRAFLFESLGKQELAIEMAEAALSLDPDDINAKLIILNCGDEKSIPKLKELEKEFSKNGESTANNVALTLFDLESSYKQKMHWANKVLRGKGDAYNKYRAIIKKGALMIEHEKDVEFTSSEMATLYSCYNFSFSQKMSGLFTPAHKILWHFYTKKNNWFMLMQLFKNSSLYWRIFDEYKAEKYYSDQISGIMNRLLPENIDLSQVRYVTVRIKQITPDYGC